MEKSFFYVVDWRDAARLRAQLQSMSIPFEIEQRDGRLTIAFPDLTVRQYNFVRALFGSDHWYPID